MFCNRKILATVIAAAIAVTACTNSEQPGITDDGVQPSGANDGSIFGRNSQISEQIREGTLNDGVVVDRPTADGPADGTHSSVAKGTSVNSVLKADNIVERAQQELVKKGYKVTVTGKLNAETTAAVRQFQKANGLEQTGKLTQTTLNALSIPVTDDTRAPASVE